MKRRRSLGGWCGLGLAVAALAGGGYAGIQYAEQHLLAAMLGNGVRAESVQWHWRQAAGCAEQVEIPLPHARDAQDQALQLYAPKLWFVYDQAAMLRKRFILPRVVIENAVISTSHDRVLAEQIVDIRSETGVELDNLVELPSDSFQGQTPSTAFAADLPAAAARRGFACQASGLALPWLDEVQAACEMVQSDEALAGRQVSIDTDMLSERIQTHFGDGRAQAQRLIADARQLQQQLVDMDNVLRQRDLTEITGRLESIKRQLINLKVDIGNTNKLLDEEQARLRASLRIEKLQLLKQADEYRANSGQDVANALLTFMVKEELVEPARAVALLSDMMRKPFDIPSSFRGQQVRHLDNQPEFAVRSARISGMLAIDGKSWPFEADGKFEVMSSTPPAELSAEKSVVGSSQWHMSIDAESADWQLSGQCPQADGPCTITLADATESALSVECQVDETSISGKGRMDLRRALARVEVIERLCLKFASLYRADELLRRLIDDSVVVDDQTPESVEFQLKALTQTAGCQLDEASVGWLSSRLQQVATARTAELYRQAAGELETLINGKFTDQKGMTATLRRDTEQYIESQQEELRRIQASANSLIEQRQTNYYFARQPGEMPR